SRPHRASIEGLRAVRAPVHAGQLSRRAGRCCPRTPWCSSCSTGEARPRCARYIQFCPSVSWFIFRKQQKMLAPGKTRNMFRVTTNQASSQRAQCAMTEKMSQNELLALTTEIVASHVSNNTVAVSDLPELIRQVYGSLTNLSPTPAPEQRSEERRVGKACRSRQAPER